mmetsp:Transcript_70625/g.229442  ORF Transcript_70625/g.229442 Transcript_70625/m.229442 type:complete len:165 (+) Transcript_70625:94-588(+)
MYDPKTWSDASAADRTTHSSALVSVRPPAMEAIRLAYMEDAGCPPPYVPTEAAARVAAELSEELAAAGAPGWGAASAVAGEASLDRDAFSKRRKAERSDSQVAGIAQGSAALDSELVSRRLSAGAQLLRHATDSAGNAAGAAGASAECAGRVATDGARDAEMEG